MDANWIKLVASPDGVEEGPYRERNLRALALRKSPHEREAHVWSVSPKAVDASTLNAWWAIIDEEERARHDAILFAGRRKEHLATYGLVREVLSKYRATSPAAWRFLRNAHGRPEIDPPDTLRFNLSNCRELVVCAVCGDADIGVDVEPLSRAHDIVDLASTVFSRAELIRWRSLPAREQPNYALSLWTLKESYVKARGVGLSLPFNHFSVIFDGASARVDIDPALDSNASRWALGFADVEGARVALCVDRGRAEVRVRFRVHRAAR